MEVSTKYDVLLGKRLNSMKLCEHSQFCIFALKSVANKSMGQVHVYWGQAAHDFIIMVITIINFTYKHKFLVHVYR